MSDETMNEAPDPHQLLIAKAHNAVHASANMMLQQAEMYGSLLQSNQETIMSLRETLRQRDEQIKALETRLQMAMSAQKRMDDGS